MAPGWTPSDGVAAAIVGFLRRIGIPVRPADLPEGTFLPGVTVAGGGLLVDEARLTWPGDLLHEAGHLAVAPAAARPQMAGGVDVPGLDMGVLETAVVPWSYAAALELRLDPAVVFHAGGYRGHSQGLLATFAAGVHPGAHLLEAAGMTATGARARALGVAPYPHMLRWLRD